MTTEPNINELKFIVFGVTGVAGGQKLKKMTMTWNTQATELVIIPKTPGTRNGPQTSWAPVVLTVSLARSVDGKAIAPVQRRHRRIEQVMR